jgi:sugar phosphate isomerase/epimerase
MPLHPIYGERHRWLICQTFLLAEELGVEKVVTMSGVGGDGKDATTINWAFFPWPPSSVALAARQWDDALALWEELTEKAARHGVQRIALELHPFHLVYNVPTLERFRDRLGPIIGATVDPSHLIWQWMDPVAVVEALGDAVFHVHLKDTAFLSEELAVAGVLDDRRFGGTRAWVQRTIGRGHDSEWWRRFLGSLVRHGYSGAAVIENEDPDQTYEDGVREAAAFLFPLIQEQMCLPQNAH